MNHGDRIEQTLEAAVARSAVPGCPPRLASALRHAVFPGGARIRPRLCLAVSDACAADHPSLAEGAAAAIELLHCASLVHDDLPCFDDAMFRRGKPSVHRAYGQALAVLAGDGLIVLAFQTLAAAGAAVPGRLADLVVTISGSVGLPAGIVAGQAWECEPETDLCEYQQQKTGSLFAAASVAGAQAAGVESASWRMLGEKLGEAYQVADDILDVASDQETRGKPVGKDLALGRPSAALHLGIPGAVRRLKLLVGEAIDSIPPCPGKAELTALIMHEAQKLLPEEISRRAA